MSDHSIITDPLALSCAEWEAFFLSLGEAAFRGRQVFQGLHKAGKGLLRAGSIEEVKGLSKALKEKISPMIAPFKASIVKREISRALPDAEEERDLSELSSEEERMAEGEATEKFLIEFQDRERVECVLMPYRFGNTLCVSSQVGCRMGCSFCASTLGGLVRNLSAGEMLEEIYLAEEATGRKISRVVIMGCGEPTDNLEAVTRFLELLHTEEGKGMSYRHMTLSTCGLPGGIPKLAELPYPVTVALSLHAPSQETRLRLMKVAGSLALDQLMEDCRLYTEKTNKRMTFEYLLIKDINASIEDAKALSSLIRQYLPLNLAHVNLIPLNPVEENDYQRPSKHEIKAFFNELKAAHISVSLRRELGQDIHAACGQLRRKESAWKKV